MIRAGTWEAVAGSAQAAIAATRFALEQGWAYALSRPPGHHAFADCAAGFCFLNNAAIAARLLADSLDARVAVIDIDVHHGNGTQSIFYESDRVFTASIHCDTSDYYPFYAGYADETGTGAGAGYNLNLALAKGTDDAAFLDGIRAALDRASALGCKGLVVALGLDAGRDDPLGAFNITDEGFGEAARLLAAFDGPGVLVQEGGYLCPALPVNLTAFLTAYSGAREST